jgi:hypothetical protein
MGLRSKDRVNNIYRILVFSRTLDSYPILRFNGYGYGPRLYISCE